MLWTLWWSYPWLLDTENLSTFGTLHVGYTIHKRKCINKFMWIYFIWFHGVPVNITFDKESSSTSHFQKSFLEALWIWLELGIGFHLQVKESLNVLYRTLGHESLHFLFRRYLEGLPLATTTFNKYSDGSIWGLVKQAMPFLYQIIFIQGGYVLGSDQVYVQKKKQLWIRFSFKTNCLSLKVDKSLIWIGGKKNFEFKVGD